MFFNLKKQRSTILFLVFVAIQLTFLPTSYSRDTELSPSVNCEKIFDKIFANSDTSKSLDATKELVYTPFEDGGGFYLRPENLEDVMGNKVVEIWPDPSDFDFAAKTIWKDIWQLESQKYELINIGFKSFEEYSARVNKVVVDHVNNYPNHSLEVYFDGSRSAAGNYFPEFRWAIHEAVIDKYLSAKKYLKPNDMEILKVLNTFSDNSDVFGLLVYDKTQLVYLKPRQLVKRLAITGQITYFGDRDFLHPSERGFQVEYGRKIDDKDDKLPFEYRISKNKLAEFRKHFYKRFKAHKTCEFTRFALFDPKLPRPLFDKFILNMMQTAVSRKMHHIVIGVDAATARLFSRYGFQMYAELPTLNQEKKEYILFMDVDSEQFKNTYKRLEESSAAVMFTSEALP